jgi:D-methionine transport system substrate-binding protein
MMFLQKLSVLLILIIGVTACHDKNSNSFTVGTIAGPESELMAVAQKVAKHKYGFDFKIIEFSDYNEPNVALNDGSLSANMFQHQPYLDQQIKDHHYKLISVGKTFVYPMGVYSTKIKTLNNLKDHASVAIPNDPSNEGRALLLLQKAGLITLRKDAGLYATPIDIADNKRQIQFTEIDAAQLARVLPDVDLAIINTNYAIPAGLIPTKDAIFREGTDSLYANIIVVRTENMNSAEVQQLVESFQSPEVKKAAEAIFKGQALVVWK